MTEHERELTRSMFGHAIDLDPVRLHRRTWWPLQPRNVVMAPRGAIWFHPKGDCYADCFANAPIALSGLFIHEMTHVWQHQRGIHLLIRRHPFCSYNYVIRPGWPLERYGIEQQAEIVRHVFLLRHGYAAPGSPPLKILESLLPF